MWDGLPYPDTGHPFCYILHAVTVGWYSLARRKASILLHTACSVTLRWSYLARHRSSILLHPNCTVMKICTLGFVLYVNVVILCMYLSFSHQISSSRSMEVSRLVILVLLLETSMSISRSSLLLSNLVSLGICTTN